MTNNQLPMQFDGLTYYFDERGVIWLKLKEVAIGLGITTITVKNNVEYTTVRWARIKKYLVDISLLPQVAESRYDGTFDPNAMTDEQIKECFIPEPVFYLLAMKAENDVARAFQVKVSFEILPAIRRTGTYTVPTAQPVKASTGKLSKALDELGSVASHIERIFGVAKGIALSKATLLVEENYNVELGAIRGLLPPADHEVGLLNPTQIGERLGLSAREVNDLLVEYKIQRRVGKGYVLTEEGKPYGEMMPYTRNGHSSYRPLFNDMTVDFIRFMSQKR